MFRDIDGIIYGMVVNFIFAVAVDKLMYGINAGKLALIVTEHGDLICEVIDECCQRGTTILNGQGGYNKEEKQVVMCACSNKEMFHVQQAVKKADPASFLIVLESNEVHGGGGKRIEREFSCHTFFNFFFTFVSKELNKEPLQSYRYLNESVEWRKLHERKMEKSNRIYSGCFYRVQSKCNKQCVCSGGK